MKPLSSHSSAGLLARHLKKHNSSLAKTSDELEGDHETKAVSWAQKSCLNFPFAS